MLKNMKIYISPRVIFALAGLGFLIVLIAQKAAEKPECVNTVVK